MSNSKECEQWSFETKAVHSGQEYEEWKNFEIVPPIVTTTTFYQNDPTKMNGHYYSRVSNPTREALERCLSALEDAKYTKVYPSGCAAVTAILHLLKSGDHIVSCDEQFGGTRLLLSDYVKIQGIELDFVDSTDLKLIKAAIKPNTKLVWLETPSNPCSKVSDIKAISDVAHFYNKNIIVAVDNTWLTPYYQRPLELGADISMYSLTKYMNGHNDVMAGSLTMNDQQIFEQMKQVQIKYGSLLSPFDCYLVNRGLKTLPLRMEKHCENAIAIATYLENHPKVLKSIHPALPSHPHHELSKKQSSGHCGMVSFHLNGTQAEVKKFIQNLRVFMSSGSLGSCSSYALIPACVSHYSMSKEDREKLEIFDTTVRLSIGLENKNDLIADLEQALKKAFE